MTPTDPPTPPGSLPASAGPPAAGGRPRRAKTQAQKLAEALGFGSGLGTEGMTIPPPVPPLTPKKAFPNPGREKLEESGFFGPGGAARAAPTASVAPTLTSFTPSGLPLPPSAPAAPPPRPAAAPTGPSGEMVRIPAGSFLFGEAKRPEELGAFSIDLFPVTNSDYARFVKATGHRPPLYWKNGLPSADLADHPVVGVDYYDAVAYARWSGKDLPFEDEWERAARGADGRTYPWGEDPDVCANTARTGLRSTIPVGFYAKNKSPEGARDMVGNAWQITHSPAPGGGIVVRGGSWYDFALYAKTHFRFAARADARNGTIGFRCVRRDSARPDAARAVPEADALAEIAKRGGLGDVGGDPAAWSPERRDLVPDLRRVKAFLAIQAGSAAEEPRPSPPKPPVKKAFDAAGTPPKPAPAAAAPVVPPRPPPPAPPRAPTPATPPPAPARPVAASPLPASASPPPSAPTAAAPPPARPSPPPPPVAPAPPKPAPAPTAAAAATPAPPKPAAPAPPPPPPPRPAPAPATAAAAAPPPSPAVKPPAPAAPAPPPPAAMPSSPPAPTPAPVPAPVAAAAPTPKPQVPAPAPAAPAAPVAPAAKPTPTFRPAPLPASVAREPVGAAVGGGEEPTSRLRLAVLVMAFLAVATIFVVILHDAFRPKPAPSTPGDADQAAAILGYPPIVAVPRLDEAPPTLVEGATPEAALESVRNGGVLFVFADPTRPQGQDTAHVAIDLHRRLRTRDVRVVLVVPREVVAGQSTERGRVLEALRQANVVTDILVLLDAGGRLRTATFGVEEDNAAVLWEGGGESWRVTPPGSGGGLQLSYLKRAVARLSKYGERPLPPAVLTPPEPATRHRPSEEERETGGEPR